MQVSGNVTKGYPIYVVGYDDVFLLVCQQCQKCVVPLHFLRVPGERWRRMLPDRGQSASTYFLPINSGQDGNAGEPV